MAIWQDLVDDHGFAARYASVKRYVARLKTTAAPEAHPTILSPPTSRGPSFTEITENPGPARWRGGGRLPVSRRAAA
jgi:hypothetical protein